MMINGTLIAQAIHFFIAYCIIDRLFLRYAVAIIFAYRQERQIEQAAIERKQELLINLRQKKAAHLQELINMMIQRSPVSQELRPIRISLQEYYQHNKPILLEHDKELLVHQMTQSMCRWATHE